MWCRTQRTYITIQDPLRIHWNGQHLPFFYGCTLGRQHRYSLITWYREPSNSDTASSPWQWIKTLRKGVQLSAGIWRWIICFHARFLSEVRIDYVIFRIQSPCVSLNLEPFNTRTACCHLCFSRLNSNQHWDQTGWIYPEYDSVETQCMGLYHGLHETWKIVEKKFILANSLRM